MKQSRKGDAMAHIAALYRYPVKGLTPELCDSLTVLPSGRVKGDRVLGVRFANSPAEDDSWSSKREMLVLMNTPGLARLQVRLDTTQRRLRIDLEGETLIDTELDQTGRTRIANALAGFAEAQDENPLRDQPERLPLRVIGDGITPRYHDNEGGQVTLHGRASVAALAEALGEPELSELRFRSNISVEGLPAWEELGWIGRGLRIGDLTFSVVKAKVRCLATHANPSTGIRDQPVLTTLTETFGHAQPTLGISLVPTNGGGVLHLGDAVQLIAE
jgi:uncharacterized protein YcbX